MLIFCLGFLHLWSRENLACSSNSFLVMSLSGFASKSNVVLLKLFGKYPIWWESLYGFFSQNAWKNSLTKFLGMEVSLWETFNYRLNFFVDVELLLNSVFVNYGVLRIMKILTVLLKYSWHRINCTHWRCTSWYTYSCIFIHGTSTTVQIMNILVTPENFLMAFWPPYLGKVF